MDVKRVLHFDTFREAYEEVAKMNLARVQDLSIRDALKEVAEEKVEKEAWEALHEV